jgi:flagellar basal-body rod modification protein FlgD
MTTPAINAASLAASAITAQSSTAGAATGAPQVGEDTFLKLLVEQLKNQDPLNPQDGAQFVAQLAQFNSVEQLIGINTKLDQLLAK